VRLQRLDPQPVGRGQPNYWKATLLHLKLGSAAPSRPTLPARSRTSSIHGIRADE
jgi:hypothetical protein